MQGVTAQRRQFGPVLFDRRQHVLLIVVADGDAGLTIGLDAFLQRRVIQFGMQAQPRLQRFFLVSIGVDFKRDFAPFHTVRLDQIPLGRNVMKSTKSSSHAVFTIKLHIVFVTKYRRKILSADLLHYLEGAFSEILSAWRCQLLEFGGECDHVHLLIDVHPALNLSILINNLKTASARRSRNRFAEHLVPFYSKPQFWHRAYFVSSVGSASLETVKSYVEAQGVTEQVRKSRD